MLRNYAFLYSGLMHDLGKWEKDLRDGKRLTRKPSVDLDAVESDCRELEMEAALEQIDWVRDFIRRGVKPTELAEEVVKLREAIMAHLRRREFIHVPSSKTKLYTEIHQRPRL